MMSVKTALCLLLFCFCISLQGQILDHSWDKIAASNDSNWLASSEAIALADNVLLLQKEIGGWPKNKQPHKITNNDKEELLQAKEKNIGATIDNGATTLELLFLSKIYKYHSNEKYRIAFLKGLDYLLQAQYKNGGWPQFYPLRKGYYSHITFNDDAMYNVLKLFYDILETDKYKHINLPVQTINEIREAFDKGIAIILKTQYKQNGKLTAWCAQHDVKTLLPAKARSYELPSLSGKESARITLLLMDIKNPSQKIKKSVHAAVKWFKETQINGLKELREYKDGKLTHKTMVTDTQAEPIWARFMELDNNTPFFCDRDGIKKKQLSEIGEERRNGYAWYTHDPAAVLRAFPNWKKRLQGEKKTNEKVDIYNMTVAKDGTGDYMSIQNAINAAKAFPNKRVTIKIKNGIYYEKVNVYEWNNKLSLIGEDKTKTIISYDDYFDKLNLGRNSTFHTPTLLVQGNDFYALNLTVKNTAGEVGQAVALAVHADRVKIENCTITGNQDTLYTTGEGFKQYFKDCYIEGTTDFIFGQATVLFENCTIHSKTNSYITAASTPKDVEYGYVFKNCQLTATKGLDQVYLGRPWRTYAKTVFLNCQLGNHIIEKGWDNWSKPDAEKTSLYAEYKNSGPGFKPEKRASWSHQLTKKQAKKYTTSIILGKTPWFKRTH